MADLRLALRRLLHAPLFTGVAVLTLALGIGANTAVFSVVNAVLLRPLPYPDEGRLVAMYGHTPDGPFNLTPPEFLQVERESRLVQSVAAYQGWRYNVSTDGQPEKIDGAVVTAGFFTVLGVTPELGQFPSPVGTNRLSTTEVVVSDGYWRASLGARADVLGKRIDLDGEPVVVVGVMPRGFDVPAGAQIWRPSPFGVPPHPLRPLEDPSNEQDMYYFDVVGRVRAGTSLAQAKVEQDAIMRRMALARHGDSPVDGSSFVTLHEDRVGESRSSLLILLGAAVVLLLIASVNLANLLLARAAVRSREWLVRAALGAGRWRIAREQLLESLLLAAIGGTAGLFIAVWGVDALRAIAPVDLQSMIAAAPDWRVLLFTLAVSVVTGIAFGVGPALQSTRGDLATGMREGGRGAIDSRARRRTRNTLAVSEIALACVLAVGAGLLVKAFIRVQGVREGFDPNGVVTLAVTLPRVKYPDDAHRARFLDQALERIRALPGVTAAGAVSRLPLNPGRSISDLKVEGRTAQPGDPNPDYLVATPGYFRTLGIPLTAGRDFTDRDVATSVRVAIVTAATARRFWGTTDVLGKRLQIRDDTWREIVGVVADVRQHALDQQPVPGVYVPYAQDAWSFYTIAVRGANAAALAGPIQQQIRAIDAGQAVYAVRTMQEVVARSLAARRFMLTLIGLFSTIALVLAAVGVYGVIAYGVAQRTREMGVRVALGALPADVVRLVVRDGLLLTGAGIAAGAAVALGLAPVLQQLLYAVQPRDPWTFAIAGGAVLAVSLLASYLPARRASRVDPLEALREE